MQRYNIFSADQATFVDASQSDWILTCDVTLPSDDTLLCLAAWLHDQALQRAPSAASSLCRSLYGLPSGDRLSLGAAAPGEGPPRNISLSTIGQLRRFRSCDATDGGADSKGAAFFRQAASESTAAALPRFRRYGPGMGLGGDGEDHRLDPPSASVHRHFGSVHTVASSIPLVIDSPGITVPRPAAGLANGNRMPGLFPSSRVVLAVQPLVNAEGGWWRPAAAMNPVDISGEDLLAMAPRQEPSQSGADDDDDDVDEDHLESNAPFRPGEHNRAVGTLGKPPREPSFRTARTGFGSLSAPPAPLKNVVPFVSSSDELSTSPLLASHHHLHAAA